MKFAKITFRVHAVQRMFERGISADDVRHVLETGEVIVRYSEDRPYPSCLMLGWREARPIHVVAAENVAESEAIVITAYKPDVEIWAEDFRSKKA